LGDERFDATDKGDIPRKPNFKLVIWKMIYRLSLDIVAFNFLCSF